MSSSPFHSPAMILAAGFGTRLLPLTKDCPKPLLEVGEKTLLDHLLDNLTACGIQQCVLNTHYLAEKIHEHLKSRQKPKIKFSHESEILETGGGVQKALPLLGKSPFFVMNADILWQDGLPLKQLERVWDEKKMDVLLLLVPLQKAQGHQGVGDYFLNANGMIQRRKDQPSAPYVYGSVHILNPQLFSGINPGKFRLTEIFDKAEQQGRLYGWVFEGSWYDIGTLEALTKAQELFKV
jgi:MurNAc alpha-1-phosphate uridylyltransferase